METIPKLTRDQDFMTWKLLMKDFLIESDAALWRSITNGPYVPKDPSNYTGEDIKQMVIDRKAHVILAKALKDTTYEGLVLVHSDQNAKELWDTLCMYHTPKGRHLSGDRVVYDIDVRLPGEAQPQLRILPITRYGSDPALVVGRQVAVNSTYICYGLKLGSIRVINLDTASRSLLKGLTQRVTDMVFFAEDVNLLASASKDGHVYVWSITEKTDEDGKPQITWEIVIAIQIVGEEEFVHPRVCWHCHEQDVVIVGIGNRVLRIDTSKVGRGEVYSAEEPLKCPVDKLINGVQFVGNHDGEVTDLSMCESITTRLVSASVDGTIKIWEDQKSTPVVVLRPHDGLPVNSVTFLTAPHCADHIILVTGGPLNREVKIWRPSDADSWHCLQTLELKSSYESRFEDAFFNQVAALPQAGLLLLANAKKNAIYVVHLEYGPNPESTRMDYIAEFAVTMPILSLTSNHEKQIVHVYCVQPQAIQCHDLDMSQCLPPANDKQDSVNGLNASKPTSAITSLDVGSFSRQMDHLQLHLR